MFAPVEDEQQAKEHTAKVSEMGDTVGTEKTFQQLDGGIAYDKPFGLDGHEEIEVYALVGEHHAKGQQDAVDGSRGSHGDVPSRDKKVAEAGSDTAYQIIDKEAFGTPEVLQHIAEHPKGKHVEYNVLPVGMHEHVGEELPHAETTRGNGVEGAHGGDVVVAIAFQHHGGKEYNEIDDKQVFHHGG